jgi:nicotinate-nucleotide--dimethylbenzimidazole phosphoribosyltransferase
MQARWDSLTKPRGSLGQLESAIIRLGLIQGTTQPTADRRAVYVFCADHGITQSGVSAYPSAVTREMVKNFLSGGAAINVLCRQFGIDTRIIDAGMEGEPISGALSHRIDSGTRNFAVEPAMSRLQAIAAVEEGIRLAHDAAERYDLVGLGEMGIGNTSAATALSCALTGLSPAQMTGRGAGLDDAGLAHKQEVLSRALSFHRLDTTDPLAALTTFGGFEIAMMAGFHLGAAAANLAVVVDGFIATSAFLAATHLAQTHNRSLLDFVLFAHASAEAGHRSLLTLFKANPLLQLDLRLGEGTGSALAINLLTTALALYRNMATFEEAAVSQSTRP